MIQQLITITQHDSFNKLIKKGIMPYLCACCPCGTVRRVEVEIDMQRIDIGQASRIVLRQGIVLCYFASLPSNVNRQIVVKTWQNARIKKEEFGSMQISSS